MTHTEAARDAVEVNCLATGRRDVDREESRGAEAATEAGDDGELAARIPLQLGVGGGEPVPRDEGDGQCRADRARGLPDLVDRRQWARRAGRRRGGTRGEDPVVGDEGVKPGASLADVQVSTCGHGQ